MLHGKTHSKWLSPIAMLILPGDRSVDLLPIRWIIILEYYNPLCRWMSPSFKYNPLS